LSRDIVVINQHAKTDETLATPESGHTLILRHVTHLLDVRHRDFSEHTRIEVYPSTLTLFGVAGDSATVMALLDSIVT
jgi:hypothetical protein